MKAAVFYGTSHGDTGEVGKDIAKALGGLLGQEIPTFDICRTQVESLAEYDILLLGCSTWNVGEMQDDWDRRCDDLHRVDLSGKRFAVFGTGDQNTYADTFADALGLLAEKIEERGAQIFGSWSTEGYDFEDSRDLRDGRFIGLPLDFENQWDMTAQRVAAWCSQLANELA